MIDRGINIKDAKEQIQNTLVSYFTKDEMGEYIFPIEKQRPVFLMGPPGVGKTAIMEQISADMNVGLLSYPMTHHTKQSVLGMAYTEKKNYDGIECEVTEYTMSEIIAAIYDLINNAGVKEGILFLDEINCVSEDLAPIMLQFLQNKVLGRHRIPDGWVVVTAGNPPEYNYSGRDFDIVTWDRLKRIDIKPELECWNEYAYNRSVHQSILSYLEFEPLHFYRVEQDVQSGLLTFVTARAWEDLSQIIILYEQHGILVDHKLLGQYLQNGVVHAHFTEFYDYYNQVKEAYPIEDILSGAYTDENIEYGKEADERERKTFIGTLFEALAKRATSVVTMDRIINELSGLIEQFTSNLSDISDKQTPYSILKEIIKVHQKDIDAAKLAKNRSRESISVSKACSVHLRNILRDLKNITDANEASTIANYYLNDMRESHNNDGIEVMAINVDNAFTYLEDINGDDTEFNSLILKLLANPYTREFLEKYECAKYLEHIS